MIEKVTTLIALTGGTLLTYMAGSDIYYSAAPVALIAYTVGVLILAAGVRSLIKRMEYR